MKPDLNIALLNAAQEIISRFSPLIEDEYERSRLSSWGALILISAMKLDEAGDSLDKENRDIIEWLLSNSRIKMLFASSLSLPSLIIDELVTFLSIKNHLFSLN